MNTEKFPLCAEILLAINLKHNKYTEEEINCKLHRKDSILAIFLFHKYRLGSSAITEIFLFDQCDLQQHPGNVSSTCHSVDAIFH